MTKITGGALLFAILLAFAVSVIFPALRNSM